MSKVARDTKAAWDAEEKYSDQPHGWIQWKGTEVCMDVYCKCGEHSHIDAEFCYHWQCPHCGTVYHCNGHIEMIEVRTFNADYDGSCVHPEKD